MRAVAATSDGKRLLVRSAPGSFQIMPIAGGPVQPVTQMQKGDVPIDFTPDDTAILAGALPGPISSRGLAGRTFGRQENFAAHYCVIGSAFATTALGATVSRDGKNYAYVYGQQMSTEYVVEGLH